MKLINWNPYKNHQLIEDRNISFEDVVFYLSHDGLVDDIQHPNKNKLFGTNYINTQIFIPPPKAFPLYMLPGICSLGPLGTAKHEAYTLKFQSSHPFFLNYVYIHDIQSVWLMKF